MREPAPPYLGEGPHALWHVSENASIERFEPHVSATAASREPRVWAVDTRHLPLYWFPRVPAWHVLGNDARRPVEMRNCWQGEPCAHRRDRMAGPHACRSRRRISPTRSDLCAGSRCRWVLAQPNGRRAARRRRARRSRQAARRIRDRASSRVEPVADLESRRRVVARVQRHSPSERAAAGWL